MQLNILFIVLALHSVALVAWGKNTSLTYDPDRSDWLHLIYDDDNFMCGNFVDLCNNFLDQIACTDRTVIGCKPDITHYVGTCKCNGKPVYQDKGSRISKELLDNRMKPEIGWMLEPWSTGPPYDFDVSFNGICQLALYRIGCPPQNRTIVIGSKNGHTPYGCTCGSYVDASTRVQELMVDKMNEAPLMEIPIFDDPFTLSVEFSIAVVLILGKIGSIVANALYLPTIIGFLLCGMGMQDIINPGLIKGAGGNGPHSTPFGEMRIFALIVVLMRAGISLKPKAIYKEGIYIFCLAIIPYFAEFIIEMFLGVKLLGWNASETGLFASILAALSPSLVIPGMLHLVEQKLGHTPKNVLTSAPIEVVLAIILYNIFSSFVTSATNPTYPWIASFPLWANILLIPVNILYSSVIGSLAGYALHRYYKYRNELTTNKVENTVTRLTNNNAGEYLFAAIATCYLLYALCQPMYLQVTSGILAVFACMLTVAELAEEKVVEQLKSGLAGLWVFVEVILFTTTGINLSFKNATGPLQSDRGISTSDIGNLVIILFVGSFGRACGVFVSMLLSLHTFPAYKRNLTYLAAVWLTTWVFTIPKATIQATLGGLPYAQHIIPGASGLTKGAYIQHATAFAVLLMAPIGVFLTAMVGKPIAAWLHEFEVTNDPNYHEVCVASASAKVDCELVDIEKIVESTDEIEGIQKLPTNEVVSNL